MKDRQVDSTPAQARIPIISSLLHCISMTVIVFLRSGFGYAYLRPRSIFMAFSWAFTLFTVYAWIDPGTWPKYSALCCFGIAAVVLYWLHFIRAFASELRGTATHDNDSGKPHTLRILSWVKVPLPPSLRIFWVLWVEPAFVLLTAVAAFWPLGAKNLSTWLFLAALCLWLKEALNYWSHLRQRKRQRDAMDDAKDCLNSGHAHQHLALPTASRKAKIRRRRVR